MRDFSDTLVELAEALGAAPEISSFLRVRGLTLDFPLEVRLKRRGEEWRFVADAPTWRWRTPFDVHPGRLRITWEEELPL